jgi:hypothetical protein
VLSAVKPFRLDAVVRHCIDFTLYRASHTQKSGYLRLFGISLTKSATTHMITAPSPAGIVLNLAIYSTDSVRYYKRAQQNPSKNSVEKN